MRNSEFNKTIQDLLKSEYRRVQSFKDYDGTKLWLKSIEKYSLKHILKGDPKKAILREIKAEYALKRIGFPSSGIVYHNLKYIVFKDAGGTLEDVYREKKFSLKIRKEIFQKAGELFGILHSNKYAHGGLALRDICWDGKNVTFLDFEKFRDTQFNYKKLSIDFYFFIHSWFKLSSESGPELLAFVDKYKNCIDKILWQEVINLPRRYNKLKNITIIINSNNKDIIVFQRAITFLKTLNEDNK